MTNHYQKFFRCFRMAPQMMFTLVMLWKVVTVRLRSSDHPERGDVPGWVMVTLMSALLVAGLLAIAAPALTTMFNDAMQQVQK